MIIDRLPPFAKRFFLPFQSSLSGRQFAHLWSLVLAVAVNLRAAKLIHLSAVTPDHGHRTRRGAFLSHGDWSAPALVEQSALGLLEAMKPKAGEVVQLILDDTRIPKRGSKMGYVSKIYDHKQRKFVHGHIVLFAAIVFRGVVLPFQIDLWKPKGHCGPRYRKLTDMAAQIIRAFGAPEGVKVQVLFDAFYLCPTVTKACEAQGFAFFSVAQRNRNLRTANGRTRRIDAQNRRAHGRSDPTQGQERADETLAQDRPAADRLLRRAPEPHRSGADGRQQAAARAVEEDHRDRDQSDQPQGQADRGDL